MKKLLLAALFAATATVARAQSAPQTKTFYGCGTFSCHTATFTLQKVPPISAYGREFSNQLTLSWTHEFSSTGGYFARNAFEWPRPFADAFLLDRFWDLVGWNNSIWCYMQTCTGLRFESITSFVEDGWTVDRVAVRGIAGAFDPRNLNPTVERIELQLVPEPASWALLGAGLGVLGITARWRRSAS